MRAREFAALGIQSIHDLIEYFPFRYEHRPKSQPIGTLVLDSTSTIVGEVRRIRKRSSAAGEVLLVDVMDGTGKCSVRWFQSPFLDDRIQIGQVIRITGKVSCHREQASFTNPLVEVFEAGVDPFRGDVHRFEPVYSASSRLSSAVIGRVIARVLDSAMGQVADFVPERIRRVRCLPPLRTAILRIHRPTRLEDVAVARRRLAYDELLLCRLAVQWARNSRHDDVVAPSIITTDEIDRRIRRRFPFELTPGQNEAVAELRRDLRGPRPMNRLLQAEVGSGKTPVALYGCLAAIARRRQAVILAPTEVLAQQHRAKVDQYLEGSRVRCATLTGSTPVSQRRSILPALAEGAIDLLVGTHALLEQNVAFGDLGLAVIDEQHKFGVAQRAALRAKGSAPHLLLLSATPIPRTLAMTVFGDMDVSTIRGLPPGRRPVETRRVAPGQIAAAWSFLRSRLQQGESAFVVYPRVEDSDALPLKAAKAEAERLASSELRGFRVDLLHGRMPPDEKSEVMGRFRRGECHVLVTTTVIEVGIDVPNATVMVVQHAERYGLSQLHQLRGRVGRGAKPSYCFLVVDPAHPVADERCRILCQTQDGFEIAEHDLRMRGPGELLGARQHGLPMFRVADLVTDADLLAWAREDAAALLQSDSSLTRPEHGPLLRELHRRHGGPEGLLRSFRLIDVA